MAKRVALVTGGTRGIGAATCDALSALGFAVIATHVDRNRKPDPSSPLIHYLRWDVGNYNECLAGVEQVESTFGPVDVLVNNAGITRDSTLAKMDPADWEEVIRTNLSGVFNMVRAVFPGMCNRGWGRIINVGSINGQAGQFGQINYSAAKAGLQGLTKSLALEGARKGVTVNLVAPGYIATEMVAEMNPDILDKIVTRIPVGRLGTPQEIARAIAFLSAEESGFITGSTLTINGGQYLT